MLAEFSWSFISGSKTGKVLRVISPRPLAGQGSQRLRLRSTFLLTGGAVGRFANRSLQGLMTWVRNCSCHLTPLPQAGEGSRG